MPVPSEKIRNYFIPFFLKLKKSSEPMTNIDYSRLYESFGKLYIPIAPNENQISIGRTNNKTLVRIIKSFSTQDWTKVLELFFKTCLSEAASFDDLFRQLNRYHDVQIRDFLHEVGFYKLEIRLKQDGIQFSRIRTENYVTPLKGENVIDRMETHICDYDYVNRIVYVTSAT